MNHTQTQKVPELRLEKKENINPQLRFKQKDGKNFPDWEERKLGEVIRTYSGGTPKSTNKSFYDGKIPFIKSGEIKSTRTEQFLTEEGLRKSSARLVQKGDLLLAIYGATSGEVSISKINGAINQAILCIQSDINNCFLYNWFVGNKDFLLNKYLQGGQGNLSADIVKSFDIILANEQEQQKIADFLSSVDRRIQLLEEKKQQLVEYKKGLMQQLFPQKGEKNPRLRFKQKDGKDFPDWEERKLGEVIRTYSGGTPKSTNKSFYEGKIPFIKSGEIKSTRTEQFLTEEGLRKSSAKLVQKGDLLLAIYGATSGEVSISKINGAINQAILCIQSDINNYFLYNWFVGNKDFLLNKYLQGGQGNLSADIVKSFDITLATEQEQQKIADCLSAVDQKIEQITKQIEHTKNFKKALLQKMFV